MDFDWRKLCSAVVLLGAIWSPRLLARACEPISSRKQPRRFPVVFGPSSTLIGAKVAKLEAWRFVGKKWEQMPLQVDEVDADGSYVLDQGLPYTKFNDDGVLDANDELSVTLGSLGDAFAGQNVTNKMRSKFNRWGRADFCSTHGMYLGSVFIGESKTESSPVKFKALFERRTAEVNTDKYHYRFRVSQPMLIGDVKIKTPAGEKDVFSGSTFVMPLVPKLFFLPTLYFGESDFTSEIESWRSGPVRSIVAVGAKLRKFFSLIDLHLFSELVFYEDFFQIPTQIEFVFDPSRYLARGTGLAYILRYPDGVEWKLESNLEPLPVGGPQSIDVTKTAYEKSQHGIFGVRGSSDLGSFVANVRVDDKALRQAPPPYLATKGSFEREDVKRAWPWLSKEQGSLGVFIEISGVKAGSYDFALDVALSNQADDGFADFQTVRAFWPDSTER